MHLQRNTLFCLLNDCQFLRELACPELLSVWVAQHPYVRSSAEEKQSRCTELLSHIDFVNTNSVIWRIPEMRNCSGFLNRLGRVKLSASSTCHLPACCYVLGLSQDEIVRASESGSAPVFSFFLATVTTCLLWRVLLCKVCWSWWIIMFQGLNCSKTILWFERFDKHKNRNTSFKTEKPNGSNFESQARLFGIA